MDRFSNPVVDKIGRNKDVASVWTIPTGPEDSRPKRRLFSGNGEDALKFYQRERQSGEDGGLLLTDHRGQAVYACS